MTLLRVVVIPVTLSLGGCFARGNMPVDVYFVQGDYQRLPDCIYRAFQDDRSLIFAQPQITRLDNPPEVRVTAVPAGSISGWEVAFTPGTNSRVRIESREIANIWGTRPAWHDVIDPAIVKCTGYEPMRAPN